jgi:ceramide glucosyltransferase
VFVTVLLSLLTLLSFGLLLWQFAAAWRFPLHRRVVDDSFAPPVVLFKPLKGLDESTTDCLRSWLAQEYHGPLRVLFGVADADDPVLPLVRALLKEFPEVAVEVVITGEPHGPNAKVANLSRLYERFLSGDTKRAKTNELLVISDADVRVPKDFLANAVVPLRDTGVGLVNCFYRLAHPTTLAMRWEAVAVNADFWSQVLQANTIKPQDFALGAAMVVRRETFERAGGFEALLDFLADDYQLGRRIAQTGARIVLSPVVVECWDRPMDFRAVWNHQLRWARAIRASQPGPYFLSVLGHALGWATLLALFGNLGGFPLVPDALLYSRAFPHEMQNALALWRVPWVLVVFFTVLVTRVLLAAALQERLTQERGALRYWWLVPAKDFLQTALWAASFLGRTVEWGGRIFRLTRDGRMIPWEQSRSRD